MTAPHPPAVELDSDRGNPRRIDLLSGALVIDGQALIDNPAQTLWSVERAREEFKVVAVDSVGMRPRSLSLLPLIEPDVIVLAPELASTRPTSAAAQALHVLAAQTERTGALIVASGVDSEVHRDNAIALGATFGIGALYSPADGDGVSAAAAQPHPTWSTPAAETSSPFRIASCGQVATLSAKQLLIEMSTHIEFQAAVAGADTMVLGTFQHARQFKGRTRQRWRTMAERISYTGVYGIDMSTMSNPGIAHYSLAPTDPLIEEWNIVVLGQFFCCVLSARDRLVGHHESDRLFDYVVSHDRGTVVRCARAILSRFDG